MLGGDGAAVAAVFRQGGGNPFYLQQLWRSGGDAAPSTGNGAAPGSGVPPAVAASLAEELASLAPRSRAFLEAAAVAGEPFEPDFAAAIGKLDAAAGLAALDDLLGLDLVRPTEVPRRFIFRHPLVRRAVYESAPGGTRMAAHARAAAALAARGAGPAERARHVEQSAGRGDDDAIACCSRPAPRPLRARRPRPRAGTPRRCGCCRTATSSGASPCASRSRPRSARSASSAPAGRRCSRRSACSRATTSRAVSS